MEIYISKLWLHHIQLSNAKTKFRLKGKGVKSRSGEGDEFVEVQVEIPRKVSRRERELYEELKSGQAESPFERFKRAFK